MSLSRLFHIDSNISADERKELNLEVNNIYSELVNNYNFITMVQQALLDLAEKESMDVTKLQELITNGDINVLNVVERMISDFLAAKPSNFDEVTAARLGEKTLRDFNQKIKTKLDATDNFQKAKITDDAGKSINIANEDNPYDLYNLFDEPFAIRRFYKGVLNAPTQTTNTGFVMNFSLHNAAGTSTLVCFDWTNKKVWLNYKNNGLITGWSPLALEGAYDDIKQEVLKVKGTHSSLDAAIRSMIPYNSVNYYTDFQKALNESAGKTLDIPAGSYTIGDLEIPSNINIRADPNAVFTLKAGSTTFFANKDTVNIGGYDKTRGITFKGGIFDIKNLKDAKAFVLSHCQDVKVDTKVINGGESQSYVVLNAIRDAEINIESLDCSAITSIGATVGLYVFNDKNTLTNQNAKPYDLTLCDNVKVNLKLKNVKKGLVEITTVDKVIHKNIIYNVQAENVLEEIGLFNNVSYFRTERVIANDIGNGLIFQVLNDSCEDFTLEGINIRNGKNKETSRGIWFKSKEGDNAPQYRNVRILNPVIKTMNAGIVTDYGVGVRITNPDVSYCQEDGIWCYYTLDWSCIGGIAKYNNQRGWPRADIHIGEGGGKKTFRAILSNCQARTVWLVGIQDSIVQNVIVKSGGFTYDKNDFNNKIDYLEVGW